MKLRILHLLAHAALFHRALTVTCPTGWEDVRGRCFWLSSEEHTFESCQTDVCGKYGATLACLQPEDSMPLSYKFGIGYTDDIFAAWIGYTRAGGKEWEWISGCPKIWSHWQAGEPNGFCGGEDCAAINGVSGLWMDLSCRLRFPCLCEYPSTVTDYFNLSVAGFRDDTCYAGCGGVTKWCSAWPFLRLYDVDDDICHWEDKDGQRRGKGVTECAKRVSERPSCSSTFSYSVGRCACSPSTGEHSNCTHRNRDATTDVFKLTGKGTELLHPGERCAYGNTIDDKYFDDLRPAQKPFELFKVWARVASVWLGFGVPSAIIMVVVMCRMCAGVSASFSNFQDEDDIFGKSGGTPTGGDAAYGPLIDGTDPTSAEAVNRWIFRAAFATTFYGVALLGLGITLSAHMAGSEAVASLEAFEMLESLVMAATKAAVTRAACMVHCRLSPVAKTLAGPWVLIFAFAKLLMAITAIGGILIFSALAQRDFESICFAIYIFRWSLLLALPLQCMAGFSIWRLQMKAAPYAQGEERVGGWVTTLVCGQFGAGTAVWWAGYLGAVHENDIAMGGCFVVAALSQLLAGTSMLMVNRKIKQHFKRPTRTQADMGVAGIVDRIPGIGRSEDQT